MFSDTMTDQNFTKNFMISFGVHVLLVLIAFIGGSTILNVMNSNKNVEIIRSSVRVDVVGMPKFTIKELREIQAEPVAKPEPEQQGAKVETKVKDETPDIINKGDIVIQEKGENKKSSFMNLITEASSKKVAPTDKKNGKLKSSNKNLDSLIIEGNRLSKGSALVGEYSDADASELSAYVQNMPELVRVHFKLPSYLLSQNLHCNITVWLTPEGGVMKTHLAASSGNGEYDARADKAIRDAAPFPKPSATLGPLLPNSGIVLKFPL